MTIQIIEATQTGDLIPGLTFAPPVEYTERDANIEAGMEFNANGWPRAACQNDIQRIGWDRAQEFKELKNHGYSISG